jgi:diketogulonate reductase-like aldo/keto reductase
LWNSDHRPERVEPAFEASLRQLSSGYVDLYLIHTPFAFQPGEEQNPRDQDGNVIYDGGVTLLDTWSAMEGLVDQGRSRATGVSDISMKKLLPQHAKLDKELPMRVIPIFRTRSIVRRLPCRPKAQRNVIPTSSSR